MTSLEHFSKGLGVFGIAIMDQISAIPEESPFIHAHISRDLFHPTFIGMSGNTRDVHASSQSNLPTQKSKIYLV